ncbi:MULTISPECIES: MarR family winged helix-turn-helix transcriptional regulator [Micromonospora]|uniref:Transcriptional regulator n=1 Tax=Micromonospora tulbaghiae TaxID=479978 RepID=A0A386WNP2_9ACTN|nr:MarR family winged helix-turn-helix transcriptional regulator [Micromonospora tulbaghiae]AYF29997.1 transcriptional regulator [Micromonospora tulbaghiae]
MNSGAADPERPQTALGADGSQLGPGVALFRFIRHWARRAPQRIALEATGSSNDVRRVVVADIVAAAQEPGHATVDVRSVAEALGIDRSVASRMVADAVNAGLVKRGVSLTDSRHAALELTDQGRELVAAARQWQNNVFDAYTSGWTPEDRQSFATLLVRFVEAATR